jgi:hypothetical protein
LYEIKSTDKITILTYIGNTIYPGASQWLEYLPSIRKAFGSTQNSTKRIEKRKTRKKLKYKFH